MTRITVEEQRLKDLPEFMRRSSRYILSQLKEMAAKPGDKNMVSFISEGGPYVGGSYFSVVGTQSDLVRAVAHMFEIFSPQYTGKGLGVEAMYEFEKFLIAKYSAEILEGPSNSRTEIVDWLKRRGFRQRRNSVWKRLGLVEPIDTAEYLSMLEQIPELCDAHSIEYANAPNAHAVRFVKKDRWKSTPENPVLVPVGVACYWQTNLEKDPVIDIKRLGILPEHRNTGYGRSFLSSLERYVSDVHAPQPCWTRAETDETDSNWYKELGYAPTKMPKLFAKRIGPATVPLSSLPVSST